MKLMKLIIGSCSILVTLFLIPSHAEALTFPVVVDWEIGGEWSNYGYMEIEQDHFAEDEIMTDNRFLLKNDITIDELNFFINLDAELRYETFYGGLENESQSDTRLREFYGELKKDDFEILAGQAFVTWGKLDDLVVLDRINPQDYTHFILYDKQERKDPVPMLQLEWFAAENIQLETIWMPFFRSSEIDFFGTNWAVFDHLKGIVAASDIYTGAQRSIVSGISIQEDDSVTDQSLDNSQIAVRLRSRIRDIDYGLYYMNLYHSLPVLRETNPAGLATKQFLYEPTLANLNSLVAAGASGDDLLLTEAHPRTHTIGADWETVWQAFGLRGEAALTIDSPYLRDDFSYVEKDLIAVGFGIDHTTVNNWYIDFQYVQNYILNYEGLYGIEEAPVQFTGTVSKSLFRGTVSAEVDWLWDASYGDWMFNPELVYKWSRAGVNLAFGVFVFEGENPSTIFGRYDNNDVVYLKLNGEF